MNKCDYTFTLFFFISQWGFYVKTDARAVKNSSCSDGIALSPLAGFLSYSEQYDHVPWKPGADLGGFGRTP